MLNELLKRVICVLTLSAIAFASTTDKISVDEILRRHVQALGGRDKIGAVRSTITHAEYREGTFVMPEGLSSHACTRTTKRFAIRRNLWATSAKDMTVAHGSGMPIREWWCGRSEPQLPPPATAPS